MVNWIEPLALKTIFIDLISEGSGELFGVLALITIGGLAGFFRMNGIVMFFLMGVFVLMFSQYIGMSLFALLAIVGGLVLGYWIGRLMKG